MKRSAAASAAVLAMTAAGCGDFVREQGRSPSQLIMTELQAVNTDGDEVSTLLSDVVTNGSIMNDQGLVGLTLILKDPGTPQIAASPTAINSVTIYRYRVEFVRTDGRNEPGRDVPYPFDSAVTFTVTQDGAASGFQLVRHTAKEEAPLEALASNNDIISTIAKVTFFGRDQAGNEVSVSGNIGIDFGNFADPED